MALNTGMTATSHGIKGVAASERSISCALRRSTTPTTAMASTAKPTGVFIQLTAGVSSVVPARVPSVRNYDGLRRGGNCR